MKIIQMLLLTGVLVLTSSCYKRNTWGVRGKGEDVTEVRSAVGFDRIQLSVDGELEFKQDSNFFLEVTAQENILAITKTEVKDHELKITFSGNVWDHHPVRVRVYAPSIKALALSGSGNITVINALKTESLDCSISGMGNITVPGIVAKSIGAKISGSGNVRLQNGTVNSTDYGISGSGDIESFGLLSNSSTCKVSGSGNIELNVKEQLDVNISGSGNIRYKGQPIIHSTISGSGHLQHVD